MRWAGLIVLLVCSSWFHPVHVSVTNLDLDPVRGKVELSVKIFADDSQDLIMNKYISIDYARGTVFSRPVDTVCTYMIFMLYQFRSDSLYS